MYVLAFLLLSAGPIFPPLMRIMGPSSIRIRKHVPPKDACPETPYMPPLSLCMNEATSPQSPSWHEEDSADTLQGDDHALALQLHREQLMECLHLRTRNCGTNRQPLSVNALGDIMARADSSTSGEKTGGGGKIRRKRAPRNVYETIQSGLPVPLGWHETDTLSKDDREEQVVQPSGTFASIQLQSNCKRRRRSSTAPDIASSEAVWDTLEWGTNHAGITAQQREGLWSYWTEIWDGWFSKGTADDSTSKVSETQQDEDGSRKDSFPLNELDPAPEFPEGVVSKSLHRLLDRGNIIDRRRLHPEDDYSDLPDAVRWNEGTYINCDLRYYDLGQLGKFDVVLVDCPWRLRAAQRQTDDETMFSNCKFWLEYNTLSNQELLDISADISCLSDQGFLFSGRVLNSQMEFAFELMNKMGYTFVDRITWVKTTRQGNMAIAQGFYLLHSSEILLVGVKTVPGEDFRLLYNSKVTNDVVLADVGRKSEKPPEVYEIIEAMMPGAQKIELFARNNNIRKGWISLGNQLGPMYDWERDVVVCDRCSKAITTGSKRYKSRTIPNRDFCGSCFPESGENTEDYFKLDNFVDEMVFHDYISCDGCGVEPLWGNRFRCMDCAKKGYNVDLCEECYDGHVLPTETEGIHKPIPLHSFEVIEIPIPAAGLPVHSRTRCQGCLRLPIIGPRIACCECSDMDLCQKCFFLRKEPRKHKSTHCMEILVDPDRIPDVSVRCDACKGLAAVGRRYKCLSCFNLDLCDACFAVGRMPFNTPSHKPWHKFLKIVS